MKKGIAFTILLLLSINHLVFSQSTVSGKIVDKESSEPIEFANIGILRTDSTLIAGYISDASGYFHFDNLPSDNYLLSCSYVGYKKQLSEITINKTNHKLEDIKLEASEVTLNNVTIEANSIIKKIDRDIIIPSDAQIKSSTDGLSLLQNMHLPRLTVNQINKKIEALGGGDVQIRINGIQAELSDISSIRPEEIVRIEYHQNPGLRYGNAAAVIDYITKRKSSGGNINTNLTNNFTNLDAIGFAEDNIQAKLNHKDSEFSLNTNWHYRNIYWKRENIDLYKYEDNTIERHEEGTPTKFKQSKINIKLNYSLVKKDKYFFNAALRYYNEDLPNDFMNREGEINITTKANRGVSFKDLSKSNIHIPSLDLYYQHHLKNNQIVILNAVGTYIKSKNTRTYNEYLKEESITDIYSDISGDKYSLILEGVYEKQFSNAKLTAGLKHIQSYTNNNYKGNTTAKVDMNNADTYGYAEFQSKLNKFNYSVGAGVSRNYYSQNDKSKKDFTFRPSVRLGYDFSNNAYIKLNSYISSDAPSLADLNDVEQQIDPFQIRRGNPNLKTSWHIANNLSAGYKYKYLSIDYFLMYVYNNKLVMGETLLEEKIFVQTTNNQKNMQRVHTNLSLKVKPWQEYITLTITPGYNYFQSTGNNYLHSHHNWTLSMGLSANYKNIILSAEYRSNHHWMWGEDLYYNEKGHFIGAGYKRPNWSLMVNTFNLFSKNYKNDNENLSRYTPKKSYVSSKDLTPLFLLNFTCNVNFGRKFDSASKRLDHSDTDSGIMSGGR